MSLAGNLRTMELPDILQWISGGRKTGTLYLQRRSVEKRIVFKDEWFDADNPAVPETDPEVVG